MATTRETRIDWLTERTWHEQDAHHWRRMAATRVRINRSMPDDARLAGAALAFVRWLTSRSAS